MAGFETYQEYQRIEDYEEDSPPGEEDLLIHKNGFACMVLSEFFELVQFLFVVTFTTFLFNCVEYDVLFANRVINHTGQSPLGPLDRNKVTLPDAILPGEQCTERSVCLLYTGIFPLYCELNSALLVAICWLL
uniref:Autophagy-related protein 9 n=1 Tax=Sinocyclocheilus anshuiensis TaxID=1608454 RepID=A0A671NAR4_9TELE